MNEWFMKRSEELQEAAEKHDRKRFHELTKELRRRSARSSATLLTDQAENLNRRKEHCPDLLNQPSDVNSYMIDNMEELLTLDSPTDLPTVTEMQRAITGMRYGKSPGNYGFPAEIYKHGGPALNNQMLRLLN